MANTFSRVIPAVLVLFLALAPGCASTGSDSKGHHFKVKKSGIHAVVVGPKAKNISIDVLRLNYTEEEVAFWVSKDKRKKLYIEFTEQPFENMKQQKNGRFRVDCRGRHCYSDEIKRDYKPKYEYKYWQVLDDGTSLEEEDGIIIIDP